MKNRLLILAVLHVVSMGKVVTQNNCNNSTGSIIGTTSGEERGKSLVALPDNHGFYAAGLKEDSVLILKVDLNGTIAWSRTFDIVPDKEEHVTAINIDDEGMLAVAGIAGDQGLGENTFIFRYDPEADEILWAKEYVSSPNNYCFSLIQLGDGGNYLVSNNPHYATLSNNDSELIEISKADGSIIPTFSKNYHLGSSEQITDMVFLNGFIYGIGRYTDGPSPSEMRNTLIKADAINGSQIWVKLGHRPSNATARLYGEDLIIEGEFIYSVYQGDPSGTSIINTKIFVQKSTLEGESIWLKQYEFPGPSEVSYEIVKSGNGFVILAANRYIPGIPYLFKVDTEGELLWAKRYLFPTFITSVHFDRGVSQLIEVGDNLVFIGYGTNISGNSDMILVITDLNGEINTLCAESESVSVAVQTINNPAIYSVMPEEFSVTPTINTVSFHWQNSIMIPRQECVLIDTIYTVLEVEICEGEAFENYTLSGTFVDTFATSEGCDSIRILHLKVTPATVHSVTIEICLGEVYEGYSQTGIFTDTFQLVSGCDSIRVLELNVIPCVPIVRYDLDACMAFMHNGTNMDYSEFMPAYPSSLTCADVEATVVFRSPPQENKHSCTPGLNDTPAMCVSALGTCTYLAGHEASVIMEVSIEPGVDSVVWLTGFEFYEKSPPVYNWIAGESGPNNYPTQFGLRVLKNGIEIYRRTGIATSPNWTLQQFNFLEEDAFRVNESTVFRFELLPYCPVGNGAMVSAWDMEDIYIYAGCLPISGHQPVIGGTVSTRDHRPMPGVSVALADESLFTFPISEETNDAGQYAIEGLRDGTSYFAKANMEDIMLNGVNTFDLIQIHKHLLGITPFTTLDQYVAADINKNGKVNVLDLVDLRKVLLGIYAQFPNNSSWRFGVLPLAPLTGDLSALEEVKFIESLAPDTTEINFIGIKVGDINNDVQLSHAGHALKNRNAINLIVEVNDTHGSKMGLTWVDVIAGSDVEMEGLQFALQMNDLNLIHVEGISLPLGTEHYSYSADGILTVSWNMYPGTKISKGDILIRVTMMSDRPGLVSDRIHIVPAGLAPEMYSDNVQYPVDFDFQQGQLPRNNEDEFDIRVEPNPFSSETKISFHNPVEGRILLRFISPSGMVLHEIDNMFGIGIQNINLRKDNLKNDEGLVYCQIISDRHLAHQLIIHTK